MRQEGQSDARNNPVNRVGKEIDTRGMQTRAVPPVDLSIGDEAVEREREEIVLVDKPMNTDYQDELAFMEEKLEITLARKSDKFAPLYEVFRVNGKALGIRVGVKTLVPRKFVEVIARAMPYDVRTVVIKHEKYEDNFVERDVIQQHPFTVNRDPNPRGAEWLERVLMES